jgi:hypothetical protein
MTLSVPRVRHCLREFALEKLFIEEFGWDRHSGLLTVQADGQAYTLNALAEKRGVQIFQCQPDAAGNIPDYASRRKIETQAAKSAYEHLIIYVDAAKIMQIWQWMARRPGQPAAYREHHYHPQHQSGDALIRKLEAITFLLSEEEGLDLTGVVFRLRDAFDRDQVTKRFYDHFKREHAVFLGFIKGITDQGDKGWYASLMLNRLMFVYFIQRKGFLDGDPDYLKNRLKRVQQRQGKGRFVTFYRYFLVRLFHEGFAQQPAQRAHDLEQLLGDIPYLNGGLFELHTLEQTHTGIDIPDEAFEHLFAFFDQYDWHLDTRPLRNDREINPDVLGYIFEKYINQKQMGAYYTKEDITEYIAKNTIIPYLFDAAEKKCAIAFQPNSALWQLLRDEPDRYIYEPVRKGVDLPLPEEIARGIGDVSQRGSWNRPAAPEFALPTETWREHVLRRQRCVELHDKLQAGEIHRINDLITYNLDIRQFAEDVISTCEGPELLRAFWQAIRAVTVLDPTCGSGAFLFAALSILEPLYEACLDRMQAFVDDLERSGEQHHPGKFSDFRRTLAEVDRHPNRRYSILKSIIVNNLYGVDIMEEAVEICKLRLFLNLVAQVDRVKYLEPLPDIDFNIRPGNTLVGFARLDGVKSTVDPLGLYQDKVDRSAEEAEIVDRAFRKFQEMQTDHGMDAREFVAAKGELRTRLEKLADELNRYLAGEYGINPDETNAYDQWRRTHQPFHWFAEFYGIMHQGGFDVIIGNPPYVVYTPSNVSYSIEPMNYQTLPTKNLYAFVFERSNDLVKNRSPVGLIVQLTALSSGRLLSLQNLLMARGPLYALPFPRRPESIFDGVEMPVVIMLSVSGPQNQLITSRVGRIYTEERPSTLATAILIPHRIRIDGYRIAKNGTPLEREIYQKIASQKRRLKDLVVNDSEFVVYYQEACRYWLKAYAGTPYFKRNGKRIAPPHGRFIYLQSSKAAAFMVCLLNSSLFYWYYSTLSDCEHVNDELVRNVPIPNRWTDNPWTELSRQLSESLERNATRKIIKTRQGHTIEYDEVKAMLSKDVIDKIDILLAECYGLPRGGLDFILNYDIKYRMGQDEGNGEE